MTVGDQIVETILLHTPLRGDEARAKALDWLKKVGIPEPERRMKSFPFELSGGQKQRVMMLSRWRPSRTTSLQTNRQRRWTFPFRLRFLIF